MNSYKTTFQTWDKLANAYQDKFMSLNLYNDTYDMFCELIEKPNATIFEIGCGPGNITKYLLTKKPDFKIDAIDVSPNMIKLAKENNPAANFSVLDCREIGKISKKYDGIVCGFCMPYLSKADVGKLISDSTNLLNRGGILYFSAIEDDYNKSTFESSSDGQHKMFIFYHEERYLQHYLLKNDFEIVTVKRIKYPKAATETATHIIFVARKKQ